MVSLSASSMAGTKGIGGLPSSPVCSSLKSSYCADIFISTFSAPDLQQAGGLIPPVALNGGYKTLAYDGEPSHGTPFGASSSAPITPASYELTLNELYYTRTPADVVGDTALRSLPNAQEQ